jgi:hypothetical protein
MDFRTLNMPGPINLNQNIAPKVDATGNFLAGMAGGRQLRLDREAGEAEQRRQNALQEYMANPGMENVNSLMIDAPQQFGQAYKVEADKMAQQQEEAEKGRQSMARMMYEIELGPEDQRSQKYDAIRAQAEQNGEQWPEEYNPQFMRQRLAQIGTDKQVEGLYGGGAELPSDVRSTQWLLNQPEDVRALHMQNKRTNQFLNTGDAHVPVNPLTGAPDTGAGLPINLKPNQSLDYVSDAETAKVTAKKGAERAAEINKAKPKFEGKVRSAQFKTKRLKNTIKEARGLISGWSTGYGAALAALPKTDARSLSNKLDTIKANLGFDELQNMRDNSPTGGALGQVAVQELEALRSVIEKLDQATDGKDLSKSLDIVEESVNQSWENVRKAYEHDYGYWPSTENPEKGGKERPPLSSFER